jgi:hypothetical protein
MEVNLQPCAPKQERKDGDLQDQVHVKRANTVPTEAHPLGGCTLEEELS